MENFFRFYSRKIIVVKSEMGMLYRFFNAIRLKLFCNGCFVFVLRTFRVESSVFAVRLTHFYVLDGRTRVVFEEKRAADRCVVVLFGHNLTHSMELTHFNLF